MKFLFTFFLLALFAFSGMAENLTTTSGEVYKDYTVRKCKAKGMAIVHATGFTTVPYDELPDDVLKKYADEINRANAKKERLRKKAKLTRLLKAYTLYFNTTQRSQSVEFIKTTKKGIIAGEYSQTVNINDSAAHVVMQRRQASPVRRVECSHIQRGGPIATSVYLPSPDVTYGREKLVRKMLIVDLARDGFTKTGYARDNYVLKIPRKHRYSANFKYSTKLGTYIHWGVCSWCRKKTPASKTKPSREYLQSLNKHYCTVPEKKNVFRVFKIGIDQKSKLEKYTVSRKKALEFIKKKNSALALK